MSTLKTIGIGAAVVAIIGGGSIALFANKSTPVSPAQTAATTSQVVGNPGSGNNNRVRPAPNPAMTALQTKYEAQLTDLATKKDEAGFTNVYKQYQADAKPIMDEQRAARQAANPSSQDANTSARSSRVAPTDVEITANIKAEYAKALANIVAKTPYTLGGQGGRGGNGGQGGNRNNNNPSSVNQK
jgi:hypothetical protein